MVSWVILHLVRRLLCVEGFYLQIARKNRADERTRTAFPCSSYEFACVRSSRYWCVRELRLFRWFSTIRQSHFVHCVPARLQYMRGRQFVLGMKLLMSARG